METCFATPLIKISTQVDLTPLDSRCSAAKGSGPTLLALHGLSPIVSSLARQLQLAAGRNLQNGQGNNLLLLLLLAAPAQRLLGRRARV